VISLDNRGGNYFFVTGWSTFIDRKDAAPEWIGGNLRKSLQTSRDLLREWGDSSLRAEKSVAESKKSGSICMEFWGRAQETYGFKC